MKDKFVVLPKRIARSRKIQVRQFEPEEIWIEYELAIKDPSTVNVAVQEATRLAIAYLDEEERRLRENNGASDSKTVGRVQTQYLLEVTKEGQMSHLRVANSNDPQFANFIHLWCGKGEKETYVGHLRKDTGEFKFKPENKKKIDMFDIKEGTHFRIIEQTST